MEENINIKIFNEKIFIDFNNLLVSNNIGAVVSFIGVVRNNNNNKKVKSIFYEVFDDLMINCVKKKCLYLLKNDKNIFFNVFQRKGMIYVGDINLILYIGSEHRKKSFLYCRLLLEFIKKNAPIWKKEFYLDNTFNWINI